MAERVDDEYPPEATIGDQRLRKDPVNAEEAVGISTVSSAELRQRVLRLAYDRYLRRGKLHGHDLDDWLAAECKVRNV